MIPSVKLSSGYNIPLIGFGTWKSPTGEVGKAVETALEVGYKHIDCAAIYGNEKEVGEAFKNKFSTGINREDVFITSKLWNSCHEKHNVRKHCEKTLKDLGLQYLDLYLIHWPISFEYREENPFADPIDENGKMCFSKVPTRETWEEMEKLVDAGLVRSIGVSNFNVQALIDLLSYARIKPAVNQVELHPYLTQPELAKFCSTHNIHLTAYSPLGNGAFVSDEIVGEIAKENKVSIPNVLCRWAVQKGFSVIPKSVTPQRIEDNFKMGSFELNQADIQKLDNLNKNYRTCDPAKFWGVPLFD